MAEDTMFQNAVEALRQDKKAEARDLLTKLLKTDQNNVTYWIWLSAAVETNKERIYCLKTALQLDPENATAKRGLVLHGALSPDEDLQPFPLNRPRLWEEQLALESDRSRETGVKAFTSNPAVRLAGFSLIGLAVLGAVVFGFILPRSNLLSPVAANTAGPSPTFTLTPTFVNATEQVRPLSGTLVPLSELLETPYTPTPLYVSTPRQPQSMDQFRVVMAAYESGDWDLVISSMLEIARSEPEAADPYYYIGEAYRFQGDWRNALENYNQALRVDGGFGPSYLGLARARLMQDQNADVTQLFDAALERDPNFGEVYLERAKFYLDRDEPELALADLDTAQRLLPGSPLVYYYQSQAYMALDNPEDALSAAENANEADITMLPVYLTLGEIYVAQGDYEQALDVLEKYTQYAPRDASAVALLGQIYFENGDCDATIETMGRALALNPNVRPAYLYRGLCYVESEEADKAESDLKRALQYYQDEFDPSLGLMRTYMLQEHFGDAYLQGERVLSLAETNEQKALAYYWRALNFELREEPENAAESWQSLLELPRGAMSRAMREEAEEHFYDIYTPTVSPTPTRRTSTPSPTKTVTRTPTPTKTTTPTPND